MEVLLTFYRRRRGTGSKPPGVGISTAAIVVTTPSPTLEGDSEAYQQLTIDLLPHYATHAHNLGVMSITINMMSYIASTCRGFKLCLDGVFNI